MNAVEILRSHRFEQAVTDMKRRAERQDPERLADIYVQGDLPRRCATTEHQLILGRRGTGKTHLLRFFQYQKQMSGEVVYYCDCTRLGSGLLNSSADPRLIGAKYFIALMADLRDMLFEKAVALENPPIGAIDRILKRLTEGFSTEVVAPGDRLQSSFDYKRIATALDAILDDLEIDRLYIVLDEWAQIPKPAQPYMAEFLKRAMLTVLSVSLKVVAVNYQCLFSEMRDGNLIGMQRGADFVDVIDIDKYLIFDENKEHVADFFGQLLYNHLGAELSWDLAVDPAAKVRHIKALFTQERAFLELVRAAEGNSRDCINIFAKAYFEGFKQSSSARAISITHIATAAGQWYMNEKEIQIKLDPVARETISFLLDRVLKTYKSRTFLVETGKEEHDRLVRLLNERILHRLNQVYSHPDRPGQRYEILTLDYGAYVLYRGTSLYPRQEVFYFAADIDNLPDEEQKTLVPLDDKRSIRRIVFDPVALDVQTGREASLSA